MNTPINMQQTKKRFGLSEWVAGLALIAGFILSILSWLEICVEHCSANHDYRLFGFPFAIFGMLFFATMVVMHFLSGSYPFFSKIVGWMIAAALGSEIMFILVQKYQIGSWCPVCLSIAASVLVAALAYSTNFFKELFSKTQSNQGETMNIFKKAFTSIAFFSLGFLFAFAGISKVDAAQVAANEMKDRITFGKKGSPVEVYFVSDWFCPSCKKVETRIEGIYPKIQSKVAFFFIDYPIHKKSLNFTPYNLSFLINNKDHYLKARQALLDLSEENDSPKDDDIVAIAKQLHIPFKELPYSDVKTGIDYFDKITKKFDLNATPTVVIYNVKTQKVSKLEGTDEISEEEVLKAIDKISKS